MSTLVPGTIVKRKDIIGKEIGPKKPACDWKTEEVWEIEYYKPKPGKIVGVWPYDYSVKNLDTLRIKFGYSGITVGNSTKYDHAISTCYDKKNIMRDCNFNVGTEDYKNIINNDDAGYYYIGEAVNHSYNCAGFEGADKRLYNPDELYNVSTYIHTRRPSSKFVSDGYKRCFHMDVLTTYVDIIMYSSYKNWYDTYIACRPKIDWGPLIESAWSSWPEDIDQREDWSDMKTRYCSKFSMTWINTKEITEFDDLFGHAKNLGLKAVWVYGYTDNGVPVPHYNDEWDNISYAAWNQGFLRQFKRKYYYYWHCIELDPCNNCDDPDANWILDHVYKTNEIKEFYP